MVGCGADEKCPQGSISEEGQCFLLESADFQVDIPDLESVQDAQLVDQLDAVDGGTSLDDATNVVAPDSLPETTGWERVNRGPLWPQRVEFLSTETTEYGPEVLCQGRQDHLLENHTGLNSPTHFEEMPRAYGAALQSPEMTKSKALRPENEIARNMAELHHVDRSPRGFANGKYNDEKDVNQRGCGRKPRRDCRGWSSGQPGTGDTLKGAV